ncbi:hypothetical protein LSTR_LSTR002675 [Laodelphax striatellus]|uniref:Uncharacterized protein n=1 Tax=Laodelphax striatellus TaxID=195883 RepID=A0A482X5N8_LAOST|nr:hypothetical protein LSTR_LSTR002675 [Laodelphax striatellus]
MFDKSDEMSSNVFKLTKEKLLSIANNATKKDSRSSNNRGYQRLKPTWIPRSCQTMKDHPTQLNFSYWNREDMSLLENWIADKPAEPPTASVDPQSNPDANFANWDTNEEDDFYSNINNQIEEVDIQQVRSIENWLQGRPDGGSTSSLESLDNDGICQLPDDNTISNDTNNNDFKTDPVIVMNDDFIEIHFDSEATLKQAQDSFNKFENKINKHIPRNRNHHVEIQPSRIIKTRGLSPRHPPLYKNFLEKANDCNTNAQNSTDSCDSLENDSNHVIDEWEESMRQSCYTEHRQLFQHLPKVEDITPVDIEATQVQHKTPNFKRIGSCKIKSEDFCASFVESKRELKNFLSFRKPKRKNQCKNKVVVGEEGVIWPAVLLTFDRGISPTPDSKPNQLSPSSC